MTTQINTKALYNADFLLWLETTANFLKTRQLEQLDYDNLIEELEAMGRSEKTALASNLRILLMHLLKWRYQPEKRTNSWKYTIAEHNIRIKKAFKDSPSLKRYFETIFDECYQDARLLAFKETSLAVDAFPDICPFTTEQVLDVDFLPE